jgi:hypothetical protein
MCVAITGLTSRQVQNFIDDGFVKIDNAFSAGIAKRCRDELWADMGLSPDAPETWTQPVIRVAAKASPPFVEAANTPPINSWEKVAGWCPEAWEPFRSAFPRHRPRVMTAGMWT